MQRAREQARCTGRVQGVGFRASCRALASELGLTGMARNEADGSVTVQVQGDPAGIERFFSSLPRRIWGRLEGCKRTSLSVVPDEAGFAVS
jgi:acylphosphatase